jgi:hypothetical protein
MVPEKIRFLIYGLLIAVPFTLAIAGAFVGFERLSYSLAIIFALLGLIFGCVAEIYVREIVGKRPTIKIIYGEDALKKAYQKLREDKDCVLTKAIWCTRYTGVSDYFERERANLAGNRNLIIQRLVNPAEIGEHEYQEYIKSSKELLKSSDKRYNIKKTKIKEFECLFCEYVKHGRRERKALLVFNDLMGKNPGLGILLDPKVDSRLDYATIAIRDWFDREWKENAEEINKENAEEINN